MSKTVYLDYAATTPILPEVLEAMTNVLANDYGNPSSIHSFGRKSKSLVEDARKTIANSIQASVAEVFFTSGATESFHTVLYSCIRDLGINTVITTKIEHHCTLHTVEQAKAEKGINLIYLETNNDGSISFDVLENTLKAAGPNSLFCTMHINNELGTKIDYSNVGRICQENNVLFYLDCAQSFGKYPIDVNQNYVAFLSASAHKLFGPKGTGLLYINNDNLIKAQILGGAQERNIRAGTENVHGMVGFAKATELCLAEMEERTQKLKEIKSYCLAQLKQNVSDISFNGPTDLKDAANHILSVSFPENEKSELLMFNLDIAGICASSGSACASGIENDSHVLETIGHDPNRKTIRFSFSHFTTKEEIDYLVSVVKKIY